MKVTDIPARRKLLIGTVAGSVPILLSKWSKPVIDTVVLPAHAQASIPTILTGSGTAVTSPFTANFTFT